MVNKVLIEKLYELSNPIIKFRIDKEMYGKDDISIENYLSSSNDLINYWLMIFNKKTIHGRQDTAYENSIAKLLEFGFTKENRTFDEQYRFLLAEKYWRDEELFERSIMQVVMYPFLIRAGYRDEKSIQEFFMKRLNKLEKTIEKYGYDFEDNTSSVPKKYQDGFIFKLDSKKESLPTIYDLYAFCFYPKDNNDITKRIENIVQYILDERFQSIPKKAYIFDSIKKRYYAASDVYHACMIKERLLLNLYLLSHFKVSSKNHLFMNDLKTLLSSRLENGFYELDKSLVKEKKDSYYIYSGSHMGLGEKRANKKWNQIESTFWILTILQNLENNNRIIKIG